MVISRQTQKKYPFLAPVDKLLTETKENGRYGQLAMIKRNGRRLLNLVNQLLDFRKMEEQELQLNKNDGEIVSFIKDATDSFYDLAERKQIKFAFKSFIEYIYMYRLITIRSSGYCSIYFQTHLNLHHQQEL